MEEDTEIAIELIADFDSGEGSISIRQEFEQENTLMKLDLLKDWIAQIQTEYDNELKNFSGWWENQQQLKSEQ